MKRIVLALVAACLTVSVAAPSHAQERISTVSKVKVIPGQGAVFHDGYPIRICFGMEANRNLQTSVTMALDMKSVKDGAKWKTTKYVLPPNTVGCIFAAAHGRGQVKLRSRVTNNERYLPSVSRVVVVTVV